ncbi:DUF982 domain-containing protein [Mesorhizobium sp. M1A.F.Ca.IN.020.06.1.1]|uniref:DUF982 domain-containing protein n=1 Tax=unclassified Mesorhizobium TaxID=325217 RepID=UPI000FCCB528|nr:MULTISPECIES: DUF982 domain-containing protein [unclassified Mesorhizobium]RUV07578.1 DUF982 domain-containing protein [Mesorhizobium sp. M1A.F.Ca.IN.020.03.2.1]RUV86267.1 DUF982 domain-containing protein [Mesorhizobium sp. M1A.F.Ca.IN.020.32.1.1]RUW14624.1 DUF982 domain-containing protein [Mesorhizobium sp. M1A.F.Ca.IN.022.05.2.1]RUW21326.1 DUF982 domain-containing protein [Mesorhizobium sp. M1A.F.Ca.IN.020.06.1.1]RWF83683.1 MAG: DUF982 domain-containing protein [Mesorhizobium sp.]
MSRFLPLTIHFVNGGTMMVSSIADAKNALGRKWKSKDSPAYRKAVRLVEDATNGICRPAIAFAAFKKAAAEQGLLEHAGPSAALSMLDQLSSRNGKGTPK